MALNYFIAASFKMIPCFFTNTKNIDIFFFVESKNNYRKWTGSKTLKKVDLSQMPDYIRENYKKYEKWLDL